MVALIASRASRQMAGKVQKRDALLSIKLKLEVAYIFEEVAGHAMQCKCHVWRYLKTIKLVLFVHGSVLVFLLMVIYVHFIKMSHHYSCCLVLLKEYFLLLVFGST